MAERVRARPFRRVLGNLAVLAVLAVVAVGTCLVVLDQRFNERGPPPPSGRGQTIVLLDRGQGLSAIAKELEDVGVISSALFFKLAVFRQGAERSLKAGEYAIPAGASMVEILAQLREGRVILHKLTIPEGLTTAQVLRLVGADPVLAGTVAAAPGEGMLMPDTYVFSRGDTRAQVVERMEKAHADFVAKAWEKRAAGLPFKDPREAIVLASIVEKETGIAEERPRVAAVFVNRLRRGMRLQSDPTIIYGLNGGEPLGRGLRVSEIARVTPYNTYAVDGLPPTPIANPSREAIAAVLNPPATGDLFFVADGTGGHAFAATEAEHRKNVARWRKIEKSRAQNTAD